MSSSVRVEIFGLVQGVGFRPFVYKTANSLNLNGFVQNSSNSVIIEIEGAKIDEFLLALTNDLPKGALISKIIKSDQIAKNYKDFVIRKSESLEQKLTPLPLDTAICDECTKELFDPTNRRFLHPFISCSACGARYTILRALPYDRESTTMSKFAMCDECKAEYTDPKSRRFHAEPIACYKCGAEFAASADQAVLALKNGEIVALKGLGGFLLLADARNDNALANLRRRKNRPYKPFAVLVETLEEAQKLADLSDHETNLISSTQKPIVVATKSSRYDLSELVAPEIDRIGIMLASNPIHHIILRKFAGALVATSANLSDEPIIANIEELEAKLSSVYDQVLNHDREIQNAIDDSVVQSVESHTIFLRSARGFAPLIVDLPRKLTTPTLAVGAEQKNTIAIGFDDKALISPHIGDLYSVDSMEFFERTISTFKRIFGFEPAQIACDLHDGYQSTIWAKSQNLPLIRVQHHHAHALAVMAENGVSSALAICFDGTGLGTDGTIWGGEFLVVTPEGFERIAHFKQFELIGADQATKNPERIAYALARNAGVLWDTNATYETMIRQKLGTVQTSSIGRLFEGLAYISGIQTARGYEGFAGLKIESFYNDLIRGEYECNITNGVIDTSELIRGASVDNHAVFASKFLHTIASVCRQVADQTDLPVVLCGGVFQNRTLTKLVLEELAHKKVFLPQKLPPNDGAISFGQLVASI